MTTTLLNSTFLNSLHRVEVTIAYLATIISLSRMCGWLFWKIQTPSKSNFFRQSTWIRNIKIKIKICCKQSIK
ncbi:hypothetical protein VIGAN_07004900 [Vigna angularis var. angularis]|uniref:Uncharacterized protein n=1 Tax=Vigna angularis var. angularis TaxID=157739 RepID=A0A0S3SF48_PHAAN|nr:hypothetical protein VIGAN_07004900 [Vigna angularis var. angularis]